ncbi:MAG: hypothetical protein KAH12_09720, partial [Anaerolineales bacterium]|nr:hypothetical protein [Anaerolineales bacterium]
VAGTDDKQDAQKKQDDPKQPDVKRPPDLLAEVGLMRQTLDNASIKYGHAFVLISESEHGWLNRESFRVGVSVLKDAAVPEGMARDSFKGGHFVMSTSKELDAEGNLGPMERWSEGALKKVAGGEVDFNGPFILRLRDEPTSASDALAVDWIVSADNLKLDDGLDDGLDEPDEKGRFDPVAAQGATVE